MMEPTSRRGEHDVAAMKDGSSSGARRFWIGMLVSVSTGVLMVVLWHGRTAKDEAVPLPDLDGFDAVVTRQIRSLHGEVEKAPSANNWVRYARALHANDLIEPAHDAYLQAARRLPGSSAFEARYLAAQALTSTDRIEEAIEHFEAAREFRADYLPVHLHLGYLSERLGRNDDARRHFTTALEYGDDSHARLGLGRVELADGNVDRAVEELRRSVALDGRNTSALTTLSGALRRAGEVEESERIARRAAGLPPVFGFPDSVFAKVVLEGDSPKRLSEIAIANLRVGRLQEALESIDKALGRAPKTPDYLFTKAHVLSRMGRYHAASSLVGDVLEVRPRDVDSLCLRAHCEARLGRRDDAIETLRSAHAVDPDHGPVRFNLGVLLGDSKSEEAQEHLAFVVTKDETNRTARYALARLLAGSDEDESRQAAKEHCRRLLADDPRHAGARTLLERLES